VRMWQCQVIEVHGVEAMSRYDDFLGADGVRRLRGLYRDDYGGLGCPAITDAVDDYLRTGEYVPTPPTVYVSYDIAANFRRSTVRGLIAQVRRLGSDHHVVVRGRRPPGTRFTPEHYFIAANIAGEVYVVDAMIPEITSDVEGYYRRQEFNGLDVASEYEATEHVTF
jgi:hypothetical protein